MNVSIDKEKCIACGACAATCPDIFELDEENKAQVKITSVPKELEQCARDGFNSCPVNAILLQE
jgi:ferredoxin